MAELKDLSKGPDVESNTPSQRHTHVPILAILVQHLLCTEISPLFTMAMEESLSGLLLGFGRKC